jgi:hypothetical protein
MAQLRHAACSAQQSCLLDGARRNALLAHQALVALFAPHGCSTCYALPSRIAACPCAGRVRRSAAALVLLRGGEGGLRVYACDRHPGQRGRLQARYDGNAIGCHARNGIALAVRRCSGATETCHSKFRTVTEHKTFPALALRIRRASASTAASHCESL